MSSPDRTPIIVGVGDFRNKSLEIRDAIEPAELMITAVRRALEDTELTPSLQDELLGLTDSVCVVPPWTWAYPDLPGLLAKRLGVNASHMLLGEHGGNQPALLCDIAARRISSGETKAAIIVGGEALASLAACQKAGRMPPPNWTKPDPAAKSVSASDLSWNGQNVGTVHSVGLAIHVYPLYENGLRAHRGQTFEENLQESAELYAAFDKTATEHPSSWRYGQPPKNARDIGTVSVKNRMICTPYPLLMNAFNTVNLAAACILTSVEHAERLGIPRERWVYPLGGAGFHESEQFWERPNYYSSPALSMAIDGALDISGLTKDKIDYFDFYSCFPIVPKLACEHLGLPIVNSSKPITLLGGLTSFGGAGNNYSMHAIAAMTRELRGKKSRAGLVLANGGVLTHQHALCLSSQPRQDGRSYPSSNPLPDERHGVPIPPLEIQAQGPATVETYTVEFDRQGSPRMGHIVGRLTGNGHRFIANHGDESTLRKLADPSVEPIGRSGFVKRGVEGKNLFYFGSEAKL
ncbi:thiolase [Phialemonium atrogriseum]|uniref:Thiolase n=1 Tax=Phialemonium atrogriseum TaxID=1093897 RepID=A0AAJ0FJ62_9PEZI|nr:thiolase [Phialemonium atrogriseum]KAK1762795.1 thiolase [Phialemonium atrogriseum]